MLNIVATSIQPALNNTIKNFVYEEKHKWKQDLKYVKALTSGFKPHYEFFDELYDFSYKILKKFTEDSQKKWKEMQLFINLKKEVNHGANGTKEYVIKKGINKGKIAK